MTILDCYMSSKCGQIGVVDMWHLPLKIFEMMPRHERIGKYFNKQVLFLKTERKKITYLGKLQVNAGDGVMSY